MATNMSSELSKKIKRKSIIKYSIESIDRFMSPFNATSQSTRLAELNVLMNTFSEIQETLVKLDDDHEDKVERLNFEGACNTPKSDTEDIVSTSNDNSSRVSATGTMGLPMV